MLAHCNCAYIFLNFTSITQVALINQMMKENSIKVKRHIPRKMIFSNFQQPDYRI